MTLEFVKNWLKIDTDDDDAVIQMCMEVAEDVIEEAVGSYDETKGQAKILYLAIIQYCYDHRDMLAAGELTKQVNHTVFTSLIRQLQVDELLKEDSGETGDTGDTGETSEDEDD